MKLLQKQSIVMIIIALGIAAIISFLVIFNNNVNHNVESEMRSYLEEIRDNAVFLLNNELEHFTAALENEARTFALLGEMSDQEILSELQCFPQNLSMTRAIILTLDGRAYSSYSGKITRFNPEDFSATFARQKDTISQPRFSESLQKMVVAVSTPLHINNECVGVLVGEYDISYFKSLFSEHFMDGNCSINLATSSGDLIARSASFPAPTHFKDNIFDFYFRDEVVFIDGSPESVRGDLRNGKSGYASYEDGELTRYVSYSPVGINDWYIAAVSTEDTLTARASVIRMYSLRLAIGIVIVMLILSVVLYFGRTIEQRETEALLRTAARTDSLTNLFNKAATAEAIDLYLKGEGASGRHALLMIDIDGFKNVNDILGHAKGDSLLAEFGGNLQSIFRSDDIVGRVGGDEFIVFIKNYGNISILSDKAKRIGDALRLTRSSDTDSELSVQTSASIGLSLYREDGKSFDELYHNADQALYSSKGDGRDRYTFYRKILHLSHQSYSSTKPDK